MTETRRDKRITYGEYAKFILTLPIPLSYEIWRELHDWVEEEGL